MSAHSIIQERSLAFAIRIVKLANHLYKQKEYIISKQILRSGTSIGANVEEAYGSITRKEFTLKFSIAYREARETMYWLVLLKEGRYIDQKLYSSFYKECLELIKMLSTSQRTLRNNKITPAPKPNPKNLLPDT